VEGVIVGVAVEHELRVGPCIVAAQPLAGSNRDCFGNRRAQGIRGRVPRCERRNRSGDAAFEHFVDQTALLVEIVLS
jgi:hypothetical protein